MALPVPSEEQIAQLPKWARVALAARCARHLASRVAQVDDGAFTAAVWRAIFECELSAEYGVASDGLAEAALAADAAHESAQDSDNVVPAMAAAVACWAAKAAQFPDEVAASAAFGAASAAYRYGAPLEAIWGDYRRLRYLASRHNWDHRTPVSLDVFDKPITAPSR